jgi:hypothetical protein
VKAASATVIAEPAHGSGIDAVRERAPEQQDDDPRDRPGGDDETDGRRRSVLHRRPGDRKCEHVIGELRAAVSTQSARSRRARVAGTAAARGSFPVVAICRTILI